MRFEVVPGRKGPNDKLVKIYSDGEVLSFSDLLFLLKNYFESEDSYYPIDKGFKGRSMLLNAIIDVSNGIPLSRVLKDYRLERKAKNTVIVEKAGSEMARKKLHEIMLGPDGV
jgi:hypothetical protein